MNALPAGLRAVLDTVLLEDAGRLVTIGDEEPLEATSRAAVRGPLAAQLYELLHTGPRTDSEKGMPRSWRDQRLEDLLAAATPHPTTVRPADLALLPHRSGSLLLALVDGVRFAIDHEALVDGLPPQVRDGQVTEWTGPVRLPATRPGLSPGFFLVDGSTGRAAAEPVLRVYLHVTGAERAPAVWTSVVSFLEERQASYRAKIGSHASLYPRRDAMVVYLGRSSWGLVDELAAHAGALGGLGEETSLLTHRVGPGVGLAFEPEDRRTGWTRFSFGEHRCHAVVDGMLARAAASDAAVRGSEAEAEVVAALRDAGADPAQPWRNTGSPGLEEIRGTGRPVSV